MVDGRTPPDLDRRFAALWSSLAPIGRDPATGGYRRLGFSEADLAGREWFVEEALDRSLHVEPEDRKSTRLNSSH